MAFDEVIVLRLVSYNPISHETCAGEPPASIGIVPFLPSPPILRETVPCGWKRDLEVDRFSADGMIHRRHRAVHANPGSWIPRRPTPAWRAERGPGPMSLDSAEIGMLAPSFAAVQRASVIARLSVAAWAAALAKQNRATEPA